MRFGGIVLSVLLVLGACSSDPEPREPSPSTPSTSSTPTEPVPTMPAQAEEDSPEGAAAFVKHYVNVFNYAARTGDTEELSALSDPACEGCQRYIDLYKKTYAAGGYFKGGDWATGSIRMEFSHPESFATTTVRSGGGRFRVSSDQPEQTSEVEKTRLAFAVGGSVTQRRITQFALGGGQ